MWVGGCDILVSTWEAGVIPSTLQCLKLPYELIRDNVFGCGKSQDGSKERIVILRL